MKNSLINKKILITGINGFVGSALENSLNSLGSMVFGMSRSGSSNKQILKADILDYSTINKFIRDSGIQICLHLASESLVEEGQSNPYKTFKVNMEGTLNILESARNNKLEKVIIASTSHVYGDNKLPYLEEYTPKPSRPYETSKTCADLIAQSYAESFNLPVLIPRFVNIYGPGDLNFTRLIPKTMKAVLSSISPQMWGGEALREYLFIDDAVDSYIKLCKADLLSLGDNRVFNFSSGSRISVKDLIEKIIDLSGKNLKIKKNDDERGLEIPSQYVSSDKAKKILKWKSKVTLEEGLKKTLIWYAKYFTQQF